METYYINLSRRLDKKKHMEANFPKAQRIEGIDGSSLYAEDILPFVVDKNWRDPYWNRRTTKGEVGCILAHLKAWTLCIELNTSIIILEDDVIALDPDWEKKVKNHKKDYDLLYLGRKHISGECLSLNDELETPGFSYWASSYMISPKLALALVTYFNTHPLIPTDEILPLITGFHRSLKTEIPEVRVAAFKNNLIVQKEGHLKNSETETPESIWKDYNFHILTVATDEDKAKKLLSTCPSIVNIGKDVEWFGGTMEGPGGGQKINLIRAQLGQYEPNDIVMFLDGYDTFIVETEEEILQRYFSFRSEVVFSSEKTCWPNSDMSDQFPETGGYKFLNSGGFIGTVSALQKIFEDPIEHHEDDQLYCQLKYLATGYNIVLDYESYIFFSLAGLEESVSVKDSYLVNKDSNCTSCILHGNGGEKTKEAFDKAFNSIKALPPILDTKDWESWKNKYLYKTTLSKQWDLLVDEPIPFVYNIPLFNEKFCKEAIELAESLDAWTENRHDNYPTNDVLLPELGLDDIYNRLLQEFVYPLCIYKYSLEGKGWDNMVSENFLARYSTDKQPSLALHHDFSNISAVVTLNEEFDGGGTYFPYFKETLNPSRIGTLSIHPGQITHRHGGRPIYSGKRYIIVSFMRNSAQALR